MIKLLKMDSAGRNNIFGDMGSPCLGLMFLKFGEIQNSARRRVSLCGAQAQGRSMGARQD